MNRTVAGIALGVLAMVGCTTAPPAARPERARVPIVFRQALSGADSATLINIAHRDDVMFVVCLSPTPLSSTAAHDSNRNSYRRVAAVNNDDIAMAVFAAANIADAPSLRVECVGASAVHVLEYSGVDLARPLIGEPVV